MSIEVFQSGGMRSAAFPVRAPRSLPSWSVFEILLLSIALLNLSLKSVKSLLGVPAYFGIFCGQGLGVPSESRPLLTSAFSISLVATEMRVLVYVDVFASWVLCVHHSFEVV